MDLHQLEPDMWYMHIIDEFTRFSNAHIIRHKDATVCIFMKCWISMFGAPCKVFSDNGGEFISDEFVDMCEAFGMKMSTTPSYSPWSNGLCERHNQTLTNILLKIKEDVKCDWDTALAWAVSAKNSLVNHNGYSPMQVVFRRNPNLPTTLTAELPALEPRPVSLIVGKHIDANISARQAFIQAESSEKIKRALRKQVQKWTTTYQIGDYVNYKRDDDKRWKGPAKVLGQDGVVVMLRHGSRQIKAHICRVQPFPGEINSEKQVISPSSHKNSPEEPVMQENSHLDDDDSENEEFDQEVLPPQGSEELTSEENPELPSTFSSEQKKIKANQKITFQHEGQQCTATVMSR